MTPRVAFILAGLTSLGACASVSPQVFEGPPTSSAADAHVIAVEQGTQRLEIQVAPSDAGLTAKSRDDLGVLASGYLRYGHGALILSSPLGGANSDAAERVAHEARMALTEAGVQYTAIAASTYDAADRTDAPVILSFTRFEARAPECAPLWEQDLAHQSNNQPWESFGCATQANLAALVEDPRDLAMARTEDPRDSGRRATVHNAYRQGQTTHAPRTNDERVTISNAVQ